jgi:hypothetical protein
MNAKKVTREAKKASSRLVNTVLLLLPAVAGGAVGAGIGRNSLLAGGALLTIANQLKWPEWMKSAAIGMAVNGVATTRPVSDAAQVAVQASQASTVSGILPFQLIEDNYRERGTQYLRNILLNAYLDKVPVVSDAVGLSGTSSGQGVFLPNKAARIKIGPAQQMELNRLISEMSSPSDIDQREFSELSDMGSIDQLAFEQGEYRSQDRRRSVA